MVLRRLFLLLLTAAAPHPALYGPPAPPRAFEQCDQAIEAVRAEPLPPTLMPAIGRVESGRLDPVTGRVRPWPWTINFEGQGSFFDTKDQVIDAVRALQAKGAKSIDVGCMQVNLMHHPTAFPDLETAFDPHANATYAAKFLTSLFAKTRNWGLAAAYYHSADPDRGEDYQRKVFGSVVTPMGGTRVRAGAGPFLPPAAQFGAIPPASTKYGAFPPSTSMFGAFGGVPAPPPAKPGRR